LTIKIYSSGALGKGPVQQYKRVVQGVADMTFGVLVYTPKIFPKTMIASKPGIGKTGAEVTRKIWKIYDKHLSSEFKKTKLLALFANWPACIITRNKAVRSVADVKGMKIRTSSPFDIPHVNAWGAVGVYIPVTKTYNALQNGVVDAVQIAPVALQRPWNLNEPGDFVTTGLDGPASLFYVMMNKKSWNGLSSAEQAAILKLTGKGASIKAAEGWGKGDLRALKAAKEGKKVKLIKLSAAEAKKFNDITAASIKKELAELDKKGMKATEIYTALAN
jgi:TRAP-type C4-dicarboxylate transport system substrate-binding protein